MLSPQTLSQSDRRQVAAWAADCAEHVLWLFEVERPGDGRLRDIIARTLAFARGEANIGAEIRLRFGGGSFPGHAISPAAAAVIKSAGQASAVCHMGAHGLGAAAYAIEAVRLADPDPEAATKEKDWQFERMTTGVKAALRALPLLGEDRSGPLGPGLLARGQIGKIIRNLQSDLLQWELSD